jgi:hypothetical protein
MMTRTAVSTAAMTLLAVALVAPSAHARNLMSADGPGGTYELLQRAYTVETPDCGHMVPHVTELFDDDLKKNVFVFHAHVNLDDDRCGAKDRQRTEIRGKAADIVADNGATVYYHWKFRLPEGFQTSPNFTHIFQIKSDMAAPIMTLTPRSGNLSIDGRIGAHGTTPLAKFIGTWVVVDLTVHFSNTGMVDMKIRRLSDGEMLFSYAGAADTWDDNASAHDPKFGIYRSLNSKADLRDEQVRFADFCVSKQSASECADDLPPPGDGGAGDDAGAGEPDAASPTGGSGGGEGGASGSGGQGGAGPASGGGGQAGAGAGGTGSGGSGGSRADAATGSGGTKSDAPRGSDPTPAETQAACSCDLGRRGGAPVAPALLLALVAAALVLARRR